MEEQLLFEEHYLHDTLTNQPAQEDTKFFTDDGIDLNELLDIDYSKLTHEIMKERVRAL